MDTLTVVTFVAGFALLILGAEALVRGASRLASALGVSPLVIGLTVVAFGTSAPELAVSVQASLAGSPDVAVGNVVGSNIFNVLFILGLSALVAPLVVARVVVRRDVPVTVLASAAVWGLALDGRVGQVEGIFLVLALVGYTVLQVRQERRDRAVAAPAAAPTPRRVPARLVVDALLVLGGLALLVLGTRWFVAGAVALARELGVSELTIGLTVVAAGTSMPELFTSLVAALRGERDIAVGNIVGSNVFNLLGILGIAAAIAPDAVPVSATLRDVDFPVMTATAMACLPVFFTGHRIARWEGVLFLAYYAVYVAYVVLAGSGDDQGLLTSWGAVLLLFIVPLTLLTLAVFAWRQWGTERRARDP